MIDQGTVVALGIAAAAGEPMQSMPSVWLIPARGIEGDRYATGRGHWAGWPDCELTIVEREVADALRVEPLTLRRNVVTHGVSLETLVGKEFSLGGARLLGVRPCDPCKYLETLLQHAGLKEALESRGGLRARIIEGGTVAVGDALRELPPR